MLRLSLLLLLALSLSGCGKYLYQQDVQQGNLVEQKDVNALKPGMTKRQVTLIMGAPALSTPFHENRWSYIRSDFRGDIDSREVKRLTLFFDNGVLIRIEGDYQPEDADAAAASDS
jgi:outer membrane protein assembly factor BamE